MTALKRLRLPDVRNHAQLELTLDTGAVCLWGANGAGKTNILEAISQLGPGRGLRAASLTDMTRHSASGWTVSAVLESGHTIGVGILPGATGYKRTIRVEGAPANIGDLSDFLRLVWLTPAMEGVFRGGAGERRKFFDRQVMAHIPAHGLAAGRYEKAMRERNALLERGRIDPAWADAIEERMADAGAQIALHRARILNRLQRAIAARPDGFFPKSLLSIDGPLEQAALAGAGQEDIKASLADKLREGRRRDQAAGRALDGPHRSDLNVVHKPSGAPAKEASTGQQKALLIGLILASARALCDVSDGPQPLILLDEAAAHLDRERRAALFDELSEMGGQAWLTGTEAFLFEAFAGRSQCVEVTANP